MFRNFKALYSLFWGGIEPKIVFHMELAKFFRKIRFFKVSRFLHNRMQKYGVFISEKAILGDNVKFPHPIGIVIGEGVVLGENVKIFQHVTLGGARIGDARQGCYPEIGSGVVIFSGAVIVGNVVVGDNAIIGANSVVITDVPENTTCVGVPGRIIYKDKSCIPDTEGIWTR